MARHLALATAVLLLGAGQAQSAPVLTPEQQNQLFPGRRSLLLEEQKGRIAILERSRSCVGLATSSLALSSCLMQERRDTMALRRRIREQMRELYTKNGIPFPEMKRDTLRRAEPVSQGVQQSI